MTSIKRPFDPHQRSHPLAEQEKRVLEATDDLWAELRQLVQDDDTLVQLEGHVRAIQRILVNRACR
jgi:hypothetical protein